MDSDICRFGRAYQIRQNLKAMEIKVPGKLFFKRKVGFIFDMNAWGRVIENTGVDYSELGDLDPEVFFTEMLFAASLSWAERSKKNVWWAKGDIAEWLDNQPQKVTKRLAQEFTDSKYFGKTMGEWAEKGDKKKQ